MTRRPIFLTHAILLCVITIFLLGGCTLPGRKTGQNTKELSSDTSTLQRRKAYLSNLTKEPRPLDADEIAIAVQIRPEFVLHLNKNLKVTDFEPLNHDAKMLRDEVYEKWYRLPYKKAYRNIMEQAIIDGYISDNNPTILLTIKEGSFDFSSNKSGRIAMTDVATIEEKLSAITENCLHLHGITGDITVSSNQRSTNK